MKTSVYMHTDNTHPGTDATRPRHGLESSRRRLEALEHSYQIQWTDCWCKN